MACLAVDGDDMTIEVQHKVFADVDEHAEALRGWNQRYQQISAGNFYSALTQVTQGTLSIFREEFSQRVTQQGIAPNGPVLTFGAVLTPSNSSTPWFQGQPLGAHDVLCISGDTQFTLHLPPNAKILGITLRQSEWNYLIPEQLRTICNQLMQCQRISVNQRDYVFLCQLIDRIINQKITGPCTTNKLADFGDLQRIPGMIVSMIVGGSLHAKSNLTQRVYADIVERCRRIVMKPTHDPVTVTALCKELKISPRTLENSFIAVTGTSPASYLRAVRLAEVRKLLNSSKQNAISINEAAARWGFSSSHFASTYKKQYGELPSALLK
jgi:AraC-like DNA-binding protein